MLNTNKVSDHINYYLLAILTTLFIWGGFEYITICNGNACIIDLKRLWYGLIIISAIFTPITLILLPYILRSIREIPKIILETIKDIHALKIFKIGLILQLAITFLCVCLFIFFFYYIELDKFAIAEKSIAATQANMFVVAATLFAPLAALIFVQDWKAQHNKNISSEIARKIWKKLDTVKILISQINHRYENLHNLSDEDFQSLSVFIKEKINNINDTMLDLYLDLRLLDESILDNKIITKFEDHIFIEIDLNKLPTTVHEEIMKLYSDVFLPKEKDLKNSLKLLIKA